MNPDYSLDPSFPRRRESSNKNSPRGGQKSDIAPLRADLSTNWIPACAGMTSSGPDGQSGLTGILQ